jgi:hypothetical protein
VEIKNNGSNISRFKLKNSALGLAREIFHAFKYNRGREVTNSKNKPKK